MAAYIDKADLIGNKLTNGAMQQKFREMTGTEAYFEFMKIVLDMPVADVEPVRYGRWVEDGDGKWHCSECKHQITVEDDFVDPNKLPIRFCQNCGADMRGADNG